MTWMDDTGVGVDVRRASGDVGLGLYLSARVSEGSGGVSGRIRWATSSVPKAQADVSDCKYDREKMPVVVVCVAPERVRPPAFFFFW
jgi:hypothetical protein